MKIYSVNVYDINQYYKIKSDKFVSITKVDKIIVTKGLFGIRELITRQQIYGFKGNFNIDQNCINYANKYGFILGINESNLTDKKIAKEHDVIDYKNKFISSNYCQYLEKNSNRYDVKRKIKNMKRKNELVGYE